MNLASEALRNNFPSFSCGDQSNDCRWSQVTTFWRKLLPVSALLQPVLCSTFPFLTPSISSVAYTIYRFIIRTINKEWIVMDLTGNCRSQIWGGENYRYTFLVVRRKSSTNICQASRSLGWDFNQGPQRYEAKVLFTQQLRSEIRHFTAKFQKLRSTNCRS
jgi:hypothetical protein